MNCIIVDDEPLAREAVEMLINETGQLTLAGSFNNAASAAKFIHEHPVDLIFLDIRMPKVTGLEFARTIPKSTLVIFTTAYAEYAIDSYEVDAVDYLVKPIIPERFQKAVEKAMAYHALLLTGEKENLKGFHLIPYRTVGKSGVMPVFELEKMYIVQKKQWIYRPLVGICEEQISEQGMYQMIINPEILGGRKNGCKSSNAAAV